MFTKETSSDSKIGCGDKTVMFPKCDGEAKIQEKETELKISEKETELKNAENKTELSTFKGKCYK